MAAFIFDVAKGREVELYSRVDGNDPTNSAFILVVLAAGHEIDESLRVYTTLASLLSLNAEVTNTGYGRKTLTDADLAAYSVDNDTHSITLPFPTQTYAAVSAGDSWSKLIGCYDSDTTGGTDANIIPVFAHDVRSQATGSVLIPNGGGIIFAWPNGLLTAR